MFERGREVKLKESVEKGKEQTFQLAVPLEIAFGASDLPSR